MEKISCTYHVRNEKGITKGQGEDQYPTDSKPEEMLTGLVTSCVETAF